MVCEARSALKASDKCSTLPGTAGPARSSYLSWQSLWPFNGCQSIWPSTWAAKEDRCMLYARHCSVCKTVHLSCVFAQLREQEHLAFLPACCCTCRYIVGANKKIQGENAEKAKPAGAEVQSVEPCQHRTRRRWSWGRWSRADMPTFKCRAVISLSLSLSVVSTGEDMRLSHCRVRIASST